MGLAEEDEDCDDRRLCDVSGSDLGMAGGSEGREGAAGSAGVTVVKEGAKVLASANTLKSDQSKTPEEGLSGGEGEGVRGGGVRV